MLKKEASSAVFLPPLWLASGRLFSRFVVPKLPPVFFFTSYLLALITLCVLHEPLFLGGIFVLSYLISGKARNRFLHKSFKSLLWFNASVSIGIAMVGWWQGVFPKETLLLLNLRVLSCVFLGVWLTSRLSLLKLCEQRPTLLLIASLFLSQSQTLQRLLSDFKMAHQSRSLQKPLLKTRLQEASSEVLTLFDKSQALSFEAMLAMRSRGVFEEGEAHEL